MQAGNLMCRWGEDKKVFVGLANSPAVMRLI